MIKYKKYATSYILTNQWCHECQMERWKRQIQYYYIWKRSTFVIESKQNGISILLFVCYTWTKEKLHAPREVQNKKDKSNTEAEETRNNCVQSTSKKYLTAIQRLSQSCDSAYSVTARATLTTYQQTTFQIKKLLNE